MATSYDHLVESASTLPVEDIEGLIEALEKLLLEIRSKPSRFVEEDR